MALPQPWPFAVLLLACPLPARAAEARAPLSAVIVDECQWMSVADDPTCQPDWALQQTGILAAQQKVRDKTGREPGAGVVIAHVDTGYTPHPLLPVLEERFLDRGWSLECDEKYDLRDLQDPAPCADRERDPHDRYNHTTLPLLRQPGHGTGTMSVLASPRQGGAFPFDRFGGVAPGASIIPYRATRGSELTDNRAWHMARAVSRAIIDPRQPATDVISMSFGRRSPYFALKRAVEAAEGRGVIVVAAAGQFSISPDGGHVRFPAANPSVVAVAGTTFTGRAWGGFKGTSQGREVDIAAPAVGVWRAESVRDKTGAWEYHVGRGAGTSYSTPLVAGTAALWLHYYGRAALERIYGKPAIAAAFLYDLHHRGYRTPDELCLKAKEEHWPSEPWICRDQRPWPKERMGSGLLAADLLLDDPAKLPSREQVCDEVFAERGGEGLAAVCPCAEGDDACTADHLDKLTRTLPRPAYIKDATLSLVSSITLGAPFGRDPSRHFYAPTVSYGILFSHHEFVQPRGILLQARGGVGGFGVQLGYGSIVEYGPLRNGEGKYAVIPGFGGAAFGVAVKGGYLRADQSDFAGGELAITAYRVKLSVGYYRGLRGPRDGTNRLIFEYGVGF